MHRSRNPLVALAIALAVTASTFTPAAAAGAAPAPREAPIRVEVNGQRKPLYPEPKLVEGQALLPLRGVRDLFLAEVVEESPDHFKIVYEDRTARIVVGQPSVEVDGARFDLDAAPVRHLSSFPRGLTEVYVPLGLIGPIFGGTATYDAERRVVVITRDVVKVLNKDLEALGPMLDAIQAQWRDRHFDATGRGSIRLYRLSNKMADEVLVDVSQTATLQLRGRDLLLRADFDGKLLEQMLAESWSLWLKGGVVHHRGKPYERWQRADQRGQSAADAALAYELGDAQKAEIRKEIEQSELVRHVRWAGAETVDGRAYRRVVIEYSLPKLNAQLRDMVAKFGAAGGVEVELKVFSLEALVAADGSHIGRVRFQMDAAARNRLLDDEYKLQLACEVKFVPSRTPIVDPGIRPGDGAF